MSRRHKDAVQIQVGACNPSAILNALVRAADDIRSARDFKGTREITHDPAIRQMVAQLAYICGVSSDGYYEGCTADANECEAKRGEQ